MSKKLFFLTSFILILGLTNGTAQAELRASLEVEPPRLIDLTAEGTADWAYWESGSLEPNVGIGDSGGTNIDIVYTDGENPASGTGDDVGNRVWIYYEDKYTLPPTVDEGYELVVTAGVANRTLKLYICNKHCNAKIVATLGDESIETIVDTGDTPDIKINYAYELEFSHPTEHELYVRYFYSPDAGYYDSVRMGAATVSGPLVQIQTQATEPRPGDGQEDVPRDVVLSWTAGVYTAPVNGHKVYFSENFNDVKDGIGGIIQSATSYAPPQRLDFNTTYYWRVDEVTPDLTVFEGRLLSFTTELFTYPVENITATASSTSQAGMGPENTINGSGLDENDLHSNEETDMWLSSAEPLGAWIQYEFDKIHKLHELWVWNSNQRVEPLVGFGFRDVTIEYSTNGADYTTLGTTHEFARAPGAADYAHNTTIDFGGAAAKYVRLTAASNWGGIMPQYGLSEVRFLHIPVHARNPYPDSGATDVDVDVVLDWAAGREGVTHDVHFGDSMQAVIDSTTPVATIAETSYGPLALDLGTTYYWRVDEVNEAETPTTWQGGLWDFTVQDHFVVDDFESYNDLDPAEPESNRIFNAWLDGYGIATNGALVGYEVPPFCERTIVHSGKQSMPLAYSNTGGAASSEAERTFAVAQNWTVAGAATLVLYFHGAEGNTGQLYVKVNGTKVVYGGDAGDIAKPEWNQWSIDLASLGVGPQNVTKLGIGIDGNGASGTLYVDDIRLYRLAPDPETN
ncbi:MAG: discoidin domain-containing protein [Planctomycetota bacterium]|jgi:hypothetical protein